MDGGTALVSAQKIDTVNSILWALARYNLALGHFVELRQLLQAKKDKELVGHLDRVLSAYLQAECAKLSPNGLTAAEEDREIARALGDQAIQHGISTMNRSHSYNALVAELCAYAMLLAAFSSFGSVVWRRFIAAMEVQ